MIQPTDRYARWMAMLAQSDQNLVLLAEIAVGAVIAWQLIARLPAPWAARLRIAFLVASGGVLLVVLTGLHPTAGQLMVAGFAAAVLLAIIRRLPGSALDWLNAIWGDLPADARQKIVDMVERERGEP